MKSIAYFCYPLVWIFSSIAHAQSVATSGWPAYGGDIGGQRYSTARQITPANVKQLRPAWVYHTGALASKRLGYHSASFENTPILFDGALYLTTPFDEIIALDAVTGKKRWSYDPAIRSPGEGYLITSRGVAIWDGHGTGPCSARVLAGTLDARLVEVDAADGKPCIDFGEKGQVKIIKNFGVPTQHQLTITSPPTVIGNIVVIGSSVPDNYAANMEPGTVRGYDVLSGKLLWTWEPLPLKGNIGAGNAWSVISADPALGLIYIPTGSPSPDYFGGLRPGNNADADSVVAVNAETGKKVWGFQLVHHDLWDYDTDAQPLLFMFHGTIPAIAVTNKTGMVYVLDRRTGTPLYPIEERRVPASDVPGEKASPTQPFSSLQLNPITLAGKCGSDLRYDGIFTPPSMGGTLEFPGKIGGVNWGSAAYDPQSGIYYAATNRWPSEVRLIKRGWRSNLSWLSPFTAWAVHFIQYLPFAHRKALMVDLILAIVGLIGLLTWRPLIYCGVLSFIFVCLGLIQNAVFNSMIAHIQDHFLHVILGVDDSPMVGTPYSLYLRPSESACSMAPGAVTAINLESGQKVWESPLKTIELGGPIVTAGGLVFSAGTRDSYLRAFDKFTGQKLWEGKLPVPAHATPMTYSIQGRQFVVIADGGHGLFETAQGDSVIAYTLPSP